MFVPERYRSFMRCCYDDQFLVDGNMNLKNFAGKWTGMFKTS